MGSCSWANINGTRIEFGMRVGEKEHRGRATRDAASTRARAAKQESASMQGNHHARRLPPTITKALAVLALLLVGCNSGTKEMPPEVLVEYRWASNVTLQIVTIQGVACVVATGNGTAISCDWSKPTPEAP